MLLKYSLAGVATLLLVSVVLGDASAPASVAEKSDNAGDAGWTSVFGCVFKEDMSTCFQHRTVRAMRKWLESERYIKAKQGKEAVKEDDDDKDDAEDLEDGQDKDKGILDQLGDIFQFGVSRFLQIVDGEEEEEKQEVEDAETEADEEDETEDDGKAIEEGRGKKKKLKKLKALIKILLLAKVIKEKIAFLLLKLGFLLQLKFFAVAVVNLLINLGRLILQWFKHKHPQKVIYYEHANHQHHYEHEHHHDYEHEEEKKGWFSGLWGRSDEENKVVNKPGQNIPYAQQYAGYRANTGQIPQGQGQDLAYAGQRPQYRVTQTTYDDEV